MSRYIQPTSSRQAPNLLIATRLGLGIRDPKWFEHRLTLMQAITAPSLLAQDDQNFEWGVFVDPDFPEPARRALDGLLRPFQGRAFIDTNGHSAQNLLKIARDRDLLKDEGDYLLTGRIDDDDAWAKGTVGAVRSRVASWLSNQQNPYIGFGLSFDTGLVWVMYDMLDIEQLQLNNDRVVRRASLRHYNHAFTGISGFVCSRASDGLTSLIAGHQEVPQKLVESGCEINVVSTPEPMWLYCRHKQTDSMVERAPGNDAMDFRLTDLSDHFGLDIAKVEKYLADQQIYGYSVGKRLAPRRGEIRAALKSARRKSQDVNLTPEKNAELHERISELEKEYARLTDELIVEPGAV